MAVTVKARTGLSMFQPKSVGNGYTFPQNLQGRDEIRAGIGQLADQVAGRLRKHGMKCQGVSLSINAAKSPMLWMPNF